jgi:hypothetical protein
MRNRNWLLVISLSLALPIFAQQASSPTSHATGTGNGSTAHKNSSTPSVAQILDWIKDKLESDSFTDWSTSDDKMADTEYRSASMEDATGCHFTLVETKTQGNETFSDGHTIVVHRIFTTKTSYDLSKLRSDVRAEKSNFGAPFTSPIKWEVRFFAVDSDSAPVSTHTANIAGTSPDTRSVEQVIYLLNQDAATRVARALGDAIAKCGGKKVKELY